MDTHYAENAEPDTREKEQRSAQRQTEAGMNDACRCKEASRMTPRELLKLMINDLAFWKKEKKG